MRYAPRDIYTHAEEYIAHCRRHPCSSRISALKIGLWGLKRALFPRDTGLKKKNQSFLTRIYMLLLFWKVELEISL